MEPVILEALTKGFETLKEKYPETDFQAVLETTVELYTAGKIVVEIIKAISKKFGIRKEDLEPVFVHIGTKSAGEPTGSVKVEVVDANPKVKIGDHATRQNEKDLPLNGQEIKFGVSKSMFPDH